MFFTSSQAFKLSHPANLPAYKEVLVRKEVENYYLPPELQGEYKYDQIFKDYEKEADIWALGMLLIEMLTRNKPSFT